MDVRYKVKTGTHSKQSNQREISTTCFGGTDTTHKHTKKREKKERFCPFCTVDGYGLTSTRDKQEIGGDQKKTEGINLATDRP